jgi:hypothetical protein
LKGSWDVLFVQEVHPGRYLLLTRSKLRPLLDFWSQISFQSHCLWVLEPSSKVEGPVPNRWTSFVHDMLADLSRVTLAANESL